MNYLPRFRRSISVFVSMCAAVTLYGQNYAEIGDAGSSFGSAQSTGATSGQALTSISGLIGNLSDGDFFYITINSPVTFSATTVNGSTSIDTMLYLFDASGNAMFLNDDAPSGTSLQSTLPTGLTLSAGTYIIGISLTGVNPVNLFNQLMFDNGLFSTDVRGPAVGAPGPVAGLLDSGFGALSGTYLIQLVGVSTSAIPEPGVTALLAFGAAGAFAYVQRRKRRR